MPIVLNELGQLIKLPEKAFGLINQHRRTHFSHTNQRMANPFKVIILDKTLTLLLCVSDDNEYRSLRER